MTKSFPVFDCDSHVVEPPQIWDEYVPAAVRPWVKTQFHFHTDTELLSILGENARRLYGIEPVLAVRERPAHHEPAKLPW